MEHANMKTIRFDQDDWIRLMASEMACYEYPDDTVVAKAQRAAFMEGVVRGVHGEQNAKDKVVNLYKALSDLLVSFRDLVQDTNSDPTFGEHPAIEAAERALFENRHLADWERQ